MSLSYNSSLLAACAVILVASLGCGASPKPEPPEPPAFAPMPPGELRPLAAFEVIADRGSRSMALFAEASRVLLHPRCVNCHPAGDRPLQRNLEAHVPPVERGPADNGIAVLECTSCHGTKNAELARVPGAPKWHLAPLEMAWQGKDLADICAQIKDKKRNGGKTLAQIVDHVAHDELVAWGWSPGADREPAPGTQAQAGELFRAWVETGAHCPPKPTEPL